MQADPLVDKPDDNTIVELSQDFISNCHIEKQYHILPFQQLNKQINVMFECLNY